MRKSRLIVFYCQFLFICHEVAALAYWPNGFRINQALFVDRQQSVKALYKVAVAASSR
jgi:hypothetical protein